MERTSESTCCCFHTHFSLTPNSRSQTHKASNTPVMKRKVQWISLRAPLSPCCSVVVHASKGETRRIQWLSTEGKSALPTDPECLEFLRNLLIFPFKSILQQAGTDLFACKPSPLLRGDSSDCWGQMLSVCRAAREGRRGDGAPGPRRRERQRLRRNPGLSHLCVQERQERDLHHHWPNAIKY